ncbi:MAG: diguanylate cyclase [Anaerolineales bacterium]|nr:diguanylate cyclase [Anaerolineales bacterium]
MKILVLENDPKELITIRQSLNINGNELIPLVRSEQIWPYLQSEEPYFLIANWDTSDIRSTQFIARVRAAKPAESFYIILTTTKSSDEDLAPSGADDIIQRPFGAQELKNRIALAERIVSLSSNLASARDQLENQAVFDSLTGFMNRPAFFRQSTGELERARRASIPLSLIALDIDNFKIINDTFGIETGDEVLRVVAQAIREKSRPYDCIGRWMGDEFVILLSGVIGADAEKVADRVIAGVRGTRIEVPNEAPLMVKVSAGIASASHINSSTEIEPLIQKARQAMSHAKQAGGNQVFLVFV